MEMKRLSKEFIREHVKIGLRREQEDNTARRESQFDGIEEFVFVQLCENTIMKLGQGFAEKNGFTTKELFEMGLKNVSTKQRRPILHRLSDMGSSLERTSMSLPLKACYTGLLPFSRLENCFRRESTLCFLQACMRCSLCGIPVKT